jgi:hypothetical protein
MTVPLKALALACAAFPLASATYPITDTFDGMPPPRLRAPMQMTVRTGAVAECGDAGPSRVFEACVRGTTVFVPNPCDYPTEKFAILLCHEQAHLQGWPAEHGP